ncbi:MAG TPA: ABC transporter ATP-binding protein [Usitatibacter sp.]|jgi:ABC-2 type transport system ATP-binding protein|nr:ABC transporter ATP-binding protein [Usitatibacter sp.]
MLIATDLCKSYGALAAVSGVSFRVNAGEIVGLLGPNGAGKTTTVSMLCGLVTPDSGTVVVTPGAAVAGGPAPVVLEPGDPMRAKRHIGLVPQEIALYEEMGAEANLRLMGALYGVAEPLLSRRVGEALALVGLADRAREKPAKFSGGMKRRLNIACALVHDPDVLLLDEPTVGVDPQSRNAIFDNLEGLRSRGKAMLYTTHYMEEAERLCDRIVVVDHGRVIAADTRENLLKLGPSLEAVFLQLTGQGLRDGA